MSKLGGLSECTLKNEADHANPCHAALGEGSCHTITDCHTRSGERDPERATRAVPIQGGTNNPLMVCLGGLYIKKKSQDPSSDAPPARCRWRSPGPPQAGAGSGPLPRPGRRTTKAESGGERLRVPDRLPACALYLGLFAPSTRPLPGGLTGSSIPWLPVPSPPRRVHARGLPSPRL